MIYKWISGQPRPKGQTWIAKPDAEYLGETAIRIKFRFETVWMKLYEGKFVGGGVTEPVFKAGTRTVVLYYSSDVNEEMLERAKAYAWEKHEAGYRGVEVYVTDWESRHNV